MKENLMRISPATQRSEVGSQRSVRPESEAPIFYRSENFVAGFVGFFVDKVYDKARDKETALHYSQRQANYDLRALSSDLSPDSSSPRDASSCISWQRLRIKALILLMACLTLLNPAHSGAAGGRSPSSTDTDDRTVERLIRRYEMQAGEMGFPTGIFRDRALEGAAKGASPSDIEAALKARLEHLSRADEILSAAEPGRGHSEIVYACMVLLVSAFESGVSPHVFDGLFAPGRRGLSHRVQAIIEAAEFLHLSGIREVEMRAFVDDAGTRELRRMEVLRAARLWVSLSREGHDTEEIRERLWHSTPDDRPRRGGGGGPMNGGRRRGPGAGQQGRRDARP